MKTLFSQEAAEELIARLEKIAPDSQPLWGKMNAPQMMSHCTALLEAARDLKQMKRVPIGYMIGPMLRKIYYNDKPFGENSPTHKLMIRTGEHEIETERPSLIEHIKGFQQDGAEKCTKSPHPFFGKLTADQWATGMYKHLDHHIRQFGA